MKFQYYHGTSTIFLESIRNHGLGKINPNTDLKNLDVLQFLAELAEKKLLDNHKYLQYRDTTIAMANQTFFEKIDQDGSS